MTNEGLTASLTTVNPWVEGTAAEDDFTDARSKSPASSSLAEQQQVDNVNLICQALLHPR